MPTEVWIRFRHILLRELEYTRVSYTFDSFWTLIFLFQFSVGVPRCVRTRLEQGEHPETTRFRLELFLMSFRLLSTFTLLTSHHPYWWSF